METWLFLHWTEIAGTLFAIVYLYFSIREKIWLWPTGFVTSFFYLIVFFQNRLYADMVLQLYYLFVSVYGWFHWLNKRNPITVGQGQPRLSTSSLTLYPWMIYGALIALLNLLIYYLLIRLPALLELPASDLPAWDAFTTAASIVATWMLARKILENWLVWIVVDTVSMGMYLYKGLYVTTFLFMVYTIMAVIGYFQWRKHMVDNNYLQFKKVNPV